MPYDWTRFSEGDAATAADVNDTFANLRDEVNDLPELSIQPRSLHHAHIPSAVGISGFKAITTASTYTNRFIGFLDTAYASAPSGTGWWRVGPMSPPDQLRVVHAPVDCGGGSDPEPISYVAMANIQMKKISLPGAGANVAENDVRHHGVFQFQLELSPDGTTTTWVNFPSTQRYSSGETEGGRSHAISNISCQKDVPLRSLFLAAQIRSWGHRYIHGARVVCAVETNYLGIEMDLHRCNLSVFSLRAPKVN